MEIEAKYRSKLYTIEIQTTRHWDYTEEKFRFRSLVNDCIGAWCSKRESAIEYGEQHAQLLIKLYPQLEDK
ncbi:MAG: hypothetical protein WC783_04225 [Candidatus Paceibacterota bacterium]|jgi:hypothetical protein